jgi:hypothetical protein
VLARSRAILSDIARAESVNKRLWTNELLEIVLAASGAQGADVYRGLHREAARDLENKKPITIHRYAPTRIYGIDLHCLDRQHVAELIRHGLEAARGHNCTEAGCIQEYRGGH